MKDRAVGSWIKWAIGIAITIVVYSLTAYSHLNEKYVGKDVFGMLCDRLERIETTQDRIETKVDRLYEDKRR